ncbi:MAG: amidohydrolase [Oscillospiraceae bacterium]
MKTILTNAKITTMEQKNYENGFISFTEGKIVAMGDMSDFSSADKSDEIVDLKGKWVYPGLVDPHGHIGMMEPIIGEKGDDVNEMTDVVTPQLNAVDAINPNDPSFMEALQGGVTTCITGPGSANPIGGQMIAIKLLGTRVDDMILKAPLAIKMAFGENPKGVYGPRKVAPMTRMSTASIIREALLKTQKYMAKENPEYDAKCEALIPLLKREIPAHMHAHRADDIYTAIRIAKEFNLDYRIVHCTEGWLIKEDLKKEGVKAFLGPILSEKSKPELTNLTTRAPGILSSFGVDVALCVDHPVIPQQYLPLCAALCVKNGMAEEEALKAVTINSARLTGLDDRIGSLKVGKDADIVVCDGNILHSFTNCISVYVNGKKAF